MDFDQRQGARMLVVDGGVRGFDERTLAGPAGAPQQYVVGGEARGEALGIVEQDVADPVDAAQEPDLDAVYLVNRLEPAAVGMPHEGVAAFQLVGKCGGRGQALQRSGDAIEQRQQIGIGLRQVWILRSGRSRRYHRGRGPRTRLGIAL